MDYELHNSICNTCSLKWTNIMIKLIFSFSFLLALASAHGQDFAGDGSLSSNATSLPNAPVSRSALAERTSVVGPQSNGAPASAPPPATGGVPNFRSYSADEILPPQTSREKFKTGLQDSFSYYSVILVGAEAGIHQADNQYPAFRQGAAGYGRYYWHSFADQADENLWVISIIPTALHEDSRYYRLGHGGFIKRTSYALSRVAVTRSDDAAPTLNVAEIVGAGAAAGISSTYYPGQYRTWTKTGQRWLSNIVVDGATFAAKEFWPDVSHSILRRH
jgi:hypothetical protein